MKKARSNRQALPSKSSLREIPELDFSRYTVRRNRFAMRVQREGIELVHDGPSAASLADMPEVDLSSARPRSRARGATSAATLYLQVGKGRPRRGQEIGPTTVRSIRLPAAVWRSLETRATRQRMTVHSMLRTAVVQYLEAPTPPRPAARRAAR